VGEEIGWRGVKESVAVEKGGRGGGRAAVSLPVSGDAGYLASLLGVGHRLGLGRCCRRCGKPLYDYATQAKGELSFKTVLIRHERKIVRTDRMKPHDQGSTAG
jgi:hypothetical protein